MKYKVGDYVLVVKKRTLNFNDEGRMDCYLGKYVKIIGFSISGERYHISQYKNDKDRIWNWRDSDFVGKIKTNER